MDRHDAEDTSEPHIMKYLPFYSENKLINLLASDAVLCQLDMNIQNAFTTFENLIILSRE